MNATNRNGNNNNDNDNNNNMIQQIKTEQNLT